MRFSVAVSAIFLATIHAASGEVGSSVFSAMDVFELEWAEEPRVSPDGEQVVYRRSGFDLMSDRRRGDLWLVRTNGKQHRKLTGFEGNESHPRWSPGGDRIAYLREAAGDGGAEIFVYWLESGNSARITRVPGKPQHLRWSPDGSQLAFQMTVDAEPPVIAPALDKPEEAQWAEEPRITDRLYHERDGSGYIEPGFSHVFVVPASGGTARQVSSGDFHHRQPSWSADGRTLFVSGNRSEDWEYDHRNTDLYALALSDGATTALTDTPGPDTQPAVSPDGTRLAWLGFADREQAYQVTRLRVAKPDGSDMRELLGDFDRSIDAITWAADSAGLYFQYDDRGRTKIGYVSLRDRFREIGDNLGGTTIGRPYGGGSFSVADNGTVAYTFTRPEHPADVSVIFRRDQSTITALNDDLLSRRELGRTEEFWWTSSYDERRMQGWIVKPPDFDPDKRYPLLIENHGGPISNYGERFSPEIQLYAAAGYVVFYPNPRGSTGYGEEFGNLLYHNYPGQDYDDIMSGMDALIAEGYIDPDALYVTGGSAGGIMSAWMIARSDRFRAAAVIKPVMNWYSKTLNADNWFRYYDVRIPGTPWTNPDDYLRFSPISLVGKVTTPTLVMVGLDDLRTPPSQAKQLYHALKYQRVPTVLVELPGASHNIAKRPSQLLAKVRHVLAWFARYPLYEKASEATAPRTM
jgi:dipeptidyl aminopeptidase/acylaminoacyl peptidase